MQSDFLQYTHLADIEQSQVDMVSNAPQDGSLELFVLNKWTHSGILIHVSVNVKCVSVLNT